RKRRGQAGRGAVATFGESLAVPATNDGARVGLAADLDSPGSRFSRGSRSCRRALGSRRGAVVPTADQLARAGSALADVLGLPELLQMAPVVLSSAAGVASYSRWGSTRTVPCCPDPRVAQRRAPDGRRGATGVGDAPPVGAAPAEPPKTGQLPGHDLALWPGRPREGEG